MLEMLEILISEVTNQTLLTGQPDADYQLLFGDVQYVGGKIVCGCVVGAGSLAVAVQCSVHTDIVTSAGPCHLSAAGPTWHQPIVAYPHACRHGILCACNACGWLC